MKSKTVQLSERYYVHDTFLSHKNIAQVKTVFPRRKNSRTALRVVVRVSRVVTLKNVLLATYKYY